MSLNVRECESLTSVQRSVIIESLLARMRSGAALERPKRAMKFRRYAQSTIKWLTPGIGVKRWLLLLVCGIALLSLGLNLLLGQLPGIFDYPAFQPIPRSLWAGILGLLGVVAVAIALIGLNRALLKPFVKADPDTVVNAIYHHSQRERGPKVVAIGGGHGLSVLLRGIKQHTSNLTAIVTVADDGGSSGRLRRELGVLPPGDFRNCIAALADDEALTTQLFQYRFPRPCSTALDLLRTNGNGGGLRRPQLRQSLHHRHGGGDRQFRAGDPGIGRVLAVRGRVVPSTLQDVTLMADLRAEPVGVSRVAGRVEHHRGGGRHRAGLSGAGRRPGLP